ncbi:Uma2 family endonuclease [Stieleria mannarensis]|uniref:Uma2 family endonuclease n=1 Tax=Stieleria mannarensis TaxID=2755585 RepID=UPI001C717D45|nr:Uma2 family endonuclease [Rhodopirellula sp. JC639]
MSRYRQSSMSPADRYRPHYTVKDHQSWEGDWELWQGIAVSMTPSPLGCHQRIARNLVVDLDVKIREAGCDANVLFEIDWIVARDTVVRPDVIVVCGETPAKQIVKWIGISQSKYFDWKKRCGKSGWKTGKSKRFSDSNRPTRWKAIVGWRS